MPSTPRDAPLGLRWLIAGMVSFAAVGSLTVWYAAPKRMPRPEYTGPAPKGGWCPGNGEFDGPTEPGKLVGDVESPAHRPANDSP